MGFQYRIAICAMLITVAIQTNRLGAENHLDQPPNIILCMADDQGWGDVGYYGKSPVKTPVLDQMSKSGLRFDRFYAAAPVCSPTRGSVLTGRHPNRFGCFSWGHRLRPQEITIAELLGQAGYATGHFGKWHLGPVVAQHGANPGASGFARWFSAPNFFENDSLMSDEGRVVQARGESSKLTMDEAIKFIRKCSKSDQRFLAVIWFGSPHGPHIATRKFLDLYPDQPPKQRHFLGEVSGIDAAMGQLRKELDGLGIRDNTLLWYTSDNGALPVGSTGGLKGRKGNLYEGGIRVPSIIEWPSRIKQPMITDHVGGTVDILPTVLAAAEVEHDDDRPLDGASLLPLLDGKLPAKRAGLGFWVYPERGISTPSTQILTQMQQAQQGGAPYRDPFPNPESIRQYPTDQFPGDAAWVDGDYKLLSLARKTNQPASLQLFNLKDDPGEQNDLAPTEPGRLESLLKQLRGWQSSVVGSLNGNDY